MAKKKVYEVSLDAGVGGGGLYRAVNMPTARKAAMKEARAFGYYPRRAIVKLVSEDELAYSKARGFDLTGKITEVK